MEDAKPSNLVVEKKLVAQDTVNDKLNNVYEECINVLTSLKRHPNSHIFFEPNPRIKAPRLKDVEQSLKLGKYHTTEQFVSAIRDIWNCFWAQTDSGSLAYIATTELSKQFEDYVIKLPYGIIKVPQHVNNPLSFSPEINNHAKKPLHNTPTKEHSKSQVVVKQPVNEIKPQTNKPVSSTSLNASIKTSPPSNKQPSTKITLPFDPSTSHRKSQNSYINPTNASIKGDDEVNLGAAKLPINAGSKSNPVVKSSSVLTAKQQISSITKTPPSPLVHADPANGSAKKQQNGNQPSMTKSPIIIPMKIDQQVKERIPGAKKEPIEIPPLSTVVSIRTSNPVTMTESKSDVISDSTLKQNNDTTVAITKKQPPLQNQVKNIPRKEIAPLEKPLEETKKIHREIDEVKIVKKRPEPEIELSYTESGICKVRM